MLEILCFFLMIIISYFGANPEAQILFPCPAQLQWILAGSIRQIYGLIISYLLHLVLNPETPKLSIFRPARFIRAFLSWKIWIPIAMLSYSFYLLHILPFFTFVFSNEYLNPDYLENPIPSRPDNPKHGKFVCPWEQGSIGVLVRFCTIALLVFVTANALSIFTFTFIEKPFNDAKRVFKNKYAK